MAPRDPDYVRLGLAAVIAAMPYGDPIKGVRFDLSNFGAPPLESLRPGC